MQITNSVVCGRSKGCIYKQIKPPSVGEHAFPLTGFVCMAALVTYFGAQRGAFSIASTNRLNRSKAVVLMWSLLAVLVSDFR